MNAKTAKKFRRIANKAAQKRDAEIMPELKFFLNHMPLMDRIKAAFKILIGRF